MPEVAECAICHGPIDEGERICRTCMGLDATFEPPEKEIVMEITPVARMATCPGPCKRSLPLTREYWYADRSRSNGFKRMCKQCQRVKDTEAHRRMDEAREKVLAKAKEIEDQERRMLPIIPGEITINMDQDGREYLTVQVHTDDKGGKYLTVEPTASLSEPHFVIRCEAMIDALAETLRHIWRQIGGDNATR